MINIHSFPSTLGKAREKKEESGERGEGRGGRR